MLINFFTGLLDFHFIFMSLKSSGLKSVSFLFFLGHELSIANMKTLLICVMLYVTNLSYRESLLER
jgi:hypothetical protein